MCSQTVDVMGVKLVTFAVPALVDYVESLVVVCVVSVHCAQLSESSKHFRLVLELPEDFTGFDCGQLSGRIPEGQIFCSGVAFLPPAP